MARASPRSPVRQLRLDWPPHGLGVDSAAVNFKWNKLNPATPPFRIANVAVS